MLQNRNPPARPLSLSPGGLLPPSQQLCEPTLGAPRGVGARDLLLHLPPYKAKRSTNSTPPPLLWGDFTPLLLSPSPPPRVSRAADCLGPANLAWGRLGWCIECNLLPSPRAEQRFRGGPKDHPSSRMAGVQPGTSDLRVHMCVPLQEHPCGALGWLARAGDEREHFPCKSLETWSLCPMKNWKSFAGTGGAGCGNEGGGLWKVMLKSTPQLVVMERLSSSVNHKMRDSWKGSGWKGH